MTGRRLPAWESGRCLLWKVSLYALKSLLADGELCGRNRIPRRGGIVQPGFPARRRALCPDEKRERAMRRSKVVLIVIAALVLGVSAAIAANVHFKNRPPLTFTDGGLTLNATGALTGLGNGDLVIQLTAQGQPVATCTNGGNHQAPGQNPTVVTLGGLQAIPGSSIKNGNVGFNVDTGGPVTPIPGAPGCPNRNWTEDINDVIFS